MLIVATAAATPAQASTVEITGAAGGQVLTLARESVGGIVTRIPGQILTDAAGYALYKDFLYPLDEPWRYNVYDSTGRPLPSTVEKMFPGSPAASNNGGTEDTESGLQFTVSAPGTITAIRWYRDPGSTAISRTVTLWSDVGLQLGNGTSASESGSGWKTTALTPSVHVGPGTYRASYDSQSRYSYLDPAPLGTSQHLAASAHFYGMPGGGTFPTIPSPLFMLTDVEFVADTFSNTIGPVPSGGHPWIRDTVFPETRYAAVTIVDVAPRSYPGRVTPFTIVGQRFRITSGDVRSGSDGSFALFCQSHAERDIVIAALSTGNPCALMVPAACKSIVDEMTFTPVDIDETRWGTSGACILDVDFIEVDKSELPPFQAVTYATQTVNATNASMDYSELATAFVGWSYNDLYRSQTGIAP